MNSFQKKIILKNRLTFLFVLLFVYVLLFEFILPINKFLPKPSLLIETFPALLTDYNMLAEMTITTTIVYLSIVIGYFIVWLFSYQFSKLISKNIGLFNNLRLFKNFPAFFFAILFAFWFGSSIIAELLFASVISAFFIVLSFMQIATNVPSEYLDSGRSLGLTGKELHKNVTWKYSLPFIFNELHRLHYYLWVLILIYEFIGSSNGFGGVYNLALSYNDLSAIIMLGIIIALLIWLGNSIIDFIEKKLVFWKV